MADKRGKDYNKRLNYDELKDKITKTKKPINAPYRTATVVRNSNQMQNLLSMSTLDMEEHSLKLQNEQMKQAKKDEMINREQPQSNVPVVSIAEDVERSQDDLQSMYEDSYELLEQRQKEQEQAAIEQNKEVLGKSGNLGSKLASAGLTGVKQLVQIGAATAAAAAGANPAVAAVAHQATGAVLQAGYEGVTGGSASSSSKERAETPPTKIPPGEEFGATPERNVDAEKAKNKEMAYKAKIETVINVMESAIKSKELNEDHIKNWRMHKEDYDDAKSSGSPAAKAAFERALRDDFAVYLSYKTGTFKSRSQSRTRSQSKTRGRSATRGGATERAKSPESAHPKSRGPLVAELREMAKKRGIKDPDKKKKPELKEALGLS